MADATSHVRQQCTNCGTLHELTHSGACDSCHDAELRLWCPIHNTEVADNHCPRCAAPAKQTKFGFVCPACFASSALPIEYAGRRVRCLTCKAILSITHDKEVTLVNRSEASSKVPASASSKSAPPVTLLRDLPPTRPPLTKARSAPPIASSAPSPVLIPSTAGPPLNRLAVASFALGLISLCVNFFGVTGIIAIVLGSQAIKVIDRSSENQRGRGLAVAGIVLGVVGTIVGCIAAIVLFSDLAK